MFCIACVCVCIPSVQPTTVSRKYDVFGRGVGVVLFLATRGRRDAPHVVQFSPRPRESVAVHRAGFLQPVRFL